MELNDKAIAGPIHMPVSPMSNLKARVQEVVNPITPYEIQVKMAVTPCLPAALMPLYAPY